MKAAQEVGRKLTESHDAARRMVVLTSTVNCALWHGRANQQGQPYAMARSVAWPCCWPCHPSGLAARLCRPMHGCACSRPLPFALSGLHLTSILP